MKLKDLWIQYKEFDHGKSENVSIQRFSEQMRELGFEYITGYAKIWFKIHIINKCLVKAGVVIIVMCKISNIGEYICIGRGRRIIIRIKYVKNNILKLSPEAVNPRF
jgi:hypothetical protein